MKKYIKSSIFLICSFLLAVIPFYTMIIKGVYSWHIQQPEVIQGAIELIIFGVLIFLFWLAMKKNTIMPFVLFAALYLSMNGVIVPVVVDILYFEMIIFIGAIFLSLKSERISSDIIKSFLMGISIWGAGAILFSLAGHGTINQMRIYSVCLFLVAMLLKKQREYSAVSLRFCIYWRNKLKKNSICIMFIILALVILALFAKTNTAQDYDSLWYGLRSQYVLVGENSFYDDLGYACFVYYYPKLVELFYLPISDLGDYSFLQCANIIVFCLLLYGIKKNIETNTDWSENNQLLILCVLATIPALANISSTAKPDIMGCSLVCIAFGYLTNYFSSKDFSDVIAGMVSLLLCTGTKLTYVLWGGILFFIFWMAYWADKKKVRICNAVKDIKSNGGMIISSVVFVCGVHYRTYKLTGYPVYPTGLFIWNKIGFSAKKFMKTDFSLRSSGLPLKTMLYRVYEFIFNPNGLEHVIMLWTSNILLVSIVLLVLYRRRKKLSFFEISLGGLYLLFSIYFMCASEVPDGNYFIAPIIILVLIFAKYIHFDSDIKDVRVVKVGLALLLITQLPIMFVSHSSWAYGTKAFSSQIIIDNFETDDKNNAILENGGMEKINYSVKNYLLQDRVIASGNQSGIQFRFDGAVEGFSEISNEHLSNSEITKTYENFRDYLNKINIKALIVFSDDTTVFSEYAEKYIEERGYVNIIEDSNAICYEIR